MNNSINFDLNNKNNIINLIQISIKKNINFIDLIDKINYLNEQIELNSFYYIELIKNYLNNNEFNSNFNFTNIFKKYIKIEENNDYKKLLIFIKKYLPFLKKDNKNIFQNISKIFKNINNNININLFLKILDIIEIIYKIDPKIKTNNLFNFNGEKTGIEFKLILKDYDKINMNNFLKNRNKKKTIYPIEKDNEIYLIFFIKFLFKDYNNDLNKNSIILLLTDITKNNILLKININENNDIIYQFNQENWIKKDNDIICKNFSIKKKENNIYDCYIKVVLKKSFLKYLDLKMFQNFYGELYYIIGIYDYIFKDDIDFIDKIMDNLNYHYDNNSYILNQLKKLENNLTTNVIDTLNNMFLILPDYINEINEEIKNEIIYNRFYNFVFFRMDKLDDFNYIIKQFNNINNEEKKIYLDLFGNNFFYIDKNIFILNQKNNLTENKVSYLGGFQILIPFFEIIYYKISEDEDKIKLLTKLLNLFNTIYKEEYFNDFKDTYNIICIILDKFNDNIIFNEKIKDELEKFISNGKYKILPYNNLEYKFFNKYYEFENDQKLYNICEKLFKIFFKNKIKNNIYENYLDLYIEKNELNNNNVENQYELNIINENNDDNLNKIFNYLLEILNIKKIVLQFPNELDLFEKIIYIFINIIKKNDFSSFNLYLFICYIIFLYFYAETNQLKINKFNNYLTNIIINCINNLTSELIDENLLENFFIYSILYLIKIINFNFDNPIITILRKNLIEGFCKFFNQINYKNSIETFEDNFLNINEENKLLFINISSMIFLKIPFNNLSIFKMLLLNKNDAKIILNLNIENYYFNFLYIFGFINKEKYNIIYYKYYYLNLYNIFQDNIKNILPTFSDTVHLNVLNYLFLPVQLKSEEIILKRLENEKQILNKYDKKSNLFSFYISETYLFLNYKKFHKKYQKIKKNLFLFNGFWSDYFIYDENDENNKKDYILKILNHITNSLKKPLLYPIFNMNTYLPNFKKLKININDIFKEKYINESFKNIDNFQNVKNKNIKNFLLNKYNLNPIECCLIKPAYHIKGFIVYKKDKIIFHSLNQFNNNNDNDINNNQNNDEEKICFEFYSKNSDANKNIDDKNKCFNSIFSYCNKERYLYIKIDLKNIKLMFDRIYNYKNNAIEIFLFNGKNYYFNFSNEENKKEILKIFKLNKDLFISQEIISVLNKKIFCYLNNNFFKIYYDNNNELNIEKNFLNYIVNSWKNFNISNFHYIMLLNLFSNRSYLDLYQYPVFPWVVLHTDKETNNINNSSNEGIIIKKEDDKSWIYYRPLTQSIGNIIYNNSNRRDLFIDSYLIMKEELGIENEEKEEEKLYIKNSKVSNLYFFNTNYSNPVYTSYYLIRLFPFTFLSIELQGGKFDTVFRLFTEYKQSCMNALSQKSDIRELIPEFYFLPEMFKNINNIDFEDKENKSEKINMNDVELLQIDKKFLDLNNNYQSNIFNKNINYYDNDNCFNFILFLSKELESKYISENIHYWINLIFGPNQKFSKKLDIINDKNFILNIFRPESYLDNPNNLEQIRRLDEILLLQSQEFGLIPLQIFNKEPQKKSNYNIDFIIDQKIYVYCQKMFPKEKPEINNLKIQFISKKSFIAIDNTFIIVFRDYNKLNDIIFTLNFFTLDKFFYQINFKNEYVISFDINILICNGFNNGKLLLLNFNNLNSINFSIFKTNNKNNFYFPNVKITAMEIITNYQSFLLCGNEIGEIFIYLIDVEKLTENNLYNILNFFKKINDNTDKILSISYNLDLNLFITASLDLFINIYNFPDCKLINCSQEDCINDNKCKVFLSDNPIPIKIIIKDGVIRVYSLNLINKNYKNKHKMISSKIYTDCNNIDSINALIIKTPNLEDCLFILGKKNDEDFKNHIYILELPTLNEFNFNIEFKNNSNLISKKKKQKIIMNDNKSKNNEIDNKKEEKKDNIDEKKNTINSLSFLPSLQYLTIFNSINKEIRVLYLKKKM